MIRMSLGMHCAFTSCAWAERGEPLADAALAGILMRGWEQSPPHRRNLLDGGTGAAARTLRPASGARYTLSQDDAGGWQVRAP
jgi:hypothetical protein